MRVEISTEAAELVLKVFNSDGVGMTRTAFAQIEPFLRTLEGNLALAQPTPPDAQKPALVNGDHGREA